MAYECRACKTEFEGEMGSCCPNCDATTDAMRYLGEDDANADWIKDIVADVENKMEEE